MTGAPLSRPTSSRSGDAFPEFGLFSLVAGDRLGGTLTRSAIRKPLRAVVVSAVTALVVPLIAVIEGNFSNPALALDLLRDIGWWNQFVLGFPMLLYIAGAYFGAFPQTLQQLTGAGVIKASEPEWKGIRAEIRTRLFSKLNIMLPYACGLMAAVFAVFVILAPDTWYNVQEYYAGWLIPLQAFLMYYFLTYLALRLVFVFLVLKLLFGYEVNIQPFHADDCGGLRSLSNLSGRLNAGVFIFGIITGLGIYSNTINYGASSFSVYNLVIFCGYLLIASIAFFLPLYATSRNMRAAKQKLADAIRERYQNLNRVMATQATERNDNTTEIAVNLSALRELRSKVRSMQVWPFNLSALLKYLLSVAIPVLILVYLWLVAPVSA